MTSQEEEDQTQADGKDGEESRKGSDKDEGEDLDDDEEEFTARVYFKKEEIATAN